MENNIQTDIRELWLGLYDLWADFKLYRNFPDQIEQMKINDGVRVTERK